MHLFFRIFLYIGFGPAPIGQFQRAMSAEPQEGSANAFARLMRPQTTSHSITSPTIIRINDGSSEGSTATDTCPDFSSAYIVKPNSSSCPSQFNSVEEHFVISKRTKGANRTYTLSAQCSFCGSFFAITNQTKMRIHLTGEREGQTRVAACGKIPPSCRQYYLDKKASNQIAAAAKLTHHRKLLQEVIDKHAPDLPSAGQKRVFESDPSNARCLTAAANLPNGQLTIMTVKNIAASSAMNLTVVRFLAASGVPPHVVELDEFKDLVQSIQALTHHFPPFPRPASAARLQPRRPPPDSDLTSPSPLRGQARVGQGRLHCLTSLPH